MTYFFLKALIWKEMEIVFELIVVDFNFSLCLTRFFISNSMTSFFLNALIWKEMEIEFEWIVVDLSFSLYCDECQQEIFHGGEQEYFYKRREKGQEKYILGMKNYKMNN